MTGALVEIIRRRREARKLKGKGGDLAALVFHRRGHAVTEFEGHGIPRAKRRGVPNLLFHDLRRSAITAMTQAHVPQLIAMQISGHKTASVFKRYSIPVESELRDAMAATEAYHAAQIAKQPASNLRAMAAK